MIIAEKILILRKKFGWSQEELAYRLNVSRQSVSKWESAASIPDINKIIEMSALFGVSTDFLLKDEITVPEFTAEEATGAKKLNLNEANAFLSDANATGRKIALGVMLCILSPILLIMLTGFASEEIKAVSISESSAAAIGTVCLLLTVAAAVAIFVFNALKSQKYDYIRKGEFDLEYGISGIIKEKKAAFSGLFNAKITIGVILCIISPVPLLCAAINENPSAKLCLIFTCLLIATVAAAVYLFIRAAYTKYGYDALLREGEYKYSANNQIQEKIAGIYWPLVTAGYLLWSFLSGDWHISWIIWPIAAVIFGGISAVFGGNGSKDS